MNHHHRPGLKCPACSPSQNLSHFSVEVKCGGCGMPLGRVDERAVSVAAAYAAVKRDLQLFHAYCDPYVVEQQRKDKP